MTARRTSGFSVLELLIVIAVLGIIFAVGFQVYPRDRILVNQAVERFERDIQRSRFNAISYNTTVRFVVDPGSDSYRAAPDPDVAGVQRSRFVVDLAREGLGGVEIAALGVGSHPDCAADSGSGEWTFDARGVGRAAPPTLVTFQHRSTGHGVSLCVNSYGRVRR